MFFSNSFFFPFIKTARNLIDKIIEFVFQVLGCFFSLARNFPAGFGSFVGGKQYAQQCTNSQRTVANVSAYIFTTARNLCLNAIRDQKPTTAVEDYHQVVYQPNHENIELAELVKTALELLPTSHREAFVLREYDGLSYQEISEVTGQSLASVKIHIFRAKEKLRKILAPYLEENTEESRRKAK